MGMNAVARPFPPRLPSLRTLLVTDALFELVVGAALLAPGSPAGRWIGSPGLAAVLGAIFLAAAAGIALLARRPLPNPAAVRALAVANVAGGVVLWALLVVAWASLPPVARAASGAVADGCLLLGVLELLSLRRAV